MLAWNRLISAIRTGRSSRASWPTRWQGTVDALESRTLLTTITVNSSLDQVANDGLVTLREAIEAANTNTAVNEAPAGEGGGVIDRIEFAITGPDFTIELASPLPALVDAVEIDGYSQPGTAVNTATEGTNATVLITLDGTAAGADVDGLVLDDGSDDSTIAGLSIVNFTGAGIEVNPGADGNTIVGNFVGLDPSGNSEGNGDDGIDLESDGNLIGGNSLADRNVFSGNADDGIDVEGSGNTVQGNLVGINLAGDAAVANGVFGIAVDTDNNLIGGVNANAANLVSGNDNIGIFLNSSASANTIQGNLVGTNASGDAAVGNSFAGIVVLGEANLIGGSNDGAGNLVSGNGEDGILIGGDENTIAGNLIGTDITGTSTIGHTDEGIAVGQGATGNIIGGTTTGAGNLVSGNATGILLAEAFQTQVLGNLIGTDITGTVALANTGEGILIDELSEDNVIGAIGAGNVISGNAGDGLEIGGSNNLIVANFIGTDITGTVALGNGVEGILVDDDATGNTIGGISPSLANVVSANGANGIELDGSGNLVLGNHIGVDLSGTVALGNSFNGVAINDGDGNTVGGTVPGARNLISGNGVFGISISTSDNTVVGILIGTDLDGTSAIGNTIGGVFIDGGTGNSIGGSELGASNLISGNAGFGVLVDSNENRVEGNRIGVDVTGLAALGNAGSGVILIGSNNSLGGADPREGNLISGNGEDGVQIVGSDNSVFGNWIGTDATGTVALGNTDDGIGLGNGASGNQIGSANAGSRNLISGNLGEGIFLSDVSGTTILNNFIGVDVTGDLDLGNGLNGILIGAESDGNTIGANNVVSGNGGNGLEIDGTNTLVVGSRFGTNAAGTAAIGNDEDGIQVDGGSNNTIGGTRIDQRNLVSGNVDDGIDLEGGVNTVQGNLIGTTADGVSPLGNGFHGVAIGEASGNVVGGSLPGAMNLISANGNTGVLVLSDANTILGNRIGTTNEGTAPLGNSFAGIVVLGNSNEIGGTDPGAGNLISGNVGDGVLIGGDGNQVQGNLIGTDVTGTQQLGNINGIGIGQGASTNLIGGAQPGSGNLISANVDDGIVVVDGDANSILGNFIGTDITGTVALGNGENGILVDSESNANQIGNLEAGNLIGGNIGNGVQVEGNNNIVAANHIGVAIDGVTPIGNGGSGVLTTAGASGNLVGRIAPGLGNAIAFNFGHGVSGGVEPVSILSNSIFGNALGGIARAGGPPAPSLTSAVTTGSATTIVGSFQGLANTTYRIEAFGNAVDPVPQARNLLATATIVTDGSGLAPFEIVAPVGLPLGEVVTATATAQIPVGMTISQSTSPISPGVSVTLA